MAETDTYKTIAGKAEGFYSDKRSRFYAFAHPVDSVAAAKTLLDSYRQAYHDARHVCWAYRLGADGADYRYNDDGEPSSTAGKPIYGQIVSKELTNVAVFVVRYYGGINLGTSGLIIAYREATAAALTQATVVERLVEETITYSFPYMLMDRVLRLVREMQARIIAQDYDNTCTITLSIRRSSAATLQQRLAALSFT